MELKKQVCTLEQAKRLKELGVVQNKRLFIYLAADEFKDNPTLCTDHSYEFDPDHDIYTGIGKVYGSWAAFNVAELGAMLGLTPDGEHTGFENRGTMHTAWYLKICKANIVYLCEAYYRAAFLIHLLENKLLLLTK